MEDEDQAAHLVSDGLDTVKEAADFLKVSVATLYNLMDRGDLLFTKIGRCRRIPHRAVVALAARGLSTPR